MYVWNIPSETFIGINSRTEYIDNQIQKNQWHILEVYLACYKVILGGQLPMLFYGSFVVQWQKSGADFNQKVSPNCGWKIWSD